MKRSVAKAPAFAAASEGRSRQANMALMPHFTKGGEVWWRGMGRLTGLSALRQKRVKVKIFIPPPYRLRKPALLRNLIYCHIYPFSVIHSLTPNTQADIEVQ
jgi:hypothetical protein